MQREWEVIQDLYKKCSQRHAYGLRSTYTRAQARAQICDGFHGDALTLGVVGDLVDGPPMAALRAIGMTRFNQLQIKPASMEVLTKFRASVKRFIAWSIGRTVNAEAAYRGLTYLHEYLNVMCDDQKGLAYIIPDFAKATLAAKEVYTGDLGKFGKTHVAGNAVLADWVYLTNRDIGRGLALKQHGRHGMDRWNEDTFNFVVLALTDVIYDKVIDVLHRQIDN